ncbi:ATP-binding protein [Rossellomorea marisflavi]|uniref:ATP-binding protein n=1 Tax=Rossellomorea marisflavi TaxID=189381 RepID=UPI0009A8ECCE|nr:ATP-binding protein [Rossellomorea marisflavi]
MRNCLLRNLKGTDFCSPMNPIYIGLHGASGNGGRVGAANIPQDYCGVLLADSPAKESQKKTYEKLEAYAKSFEKHFVDAQAELSEQGKTDNEIRIKSLYLWSESPGTGKTTTASALLNEWILRTYVGYLKRKQAAPQRLGYFLDANALQRDYNAFNRPRVPESIAGPAADKYYKALERGKHTPFVVLDDIGMRDVTDGFRGDLHDVINYRVTNKMPTIYTSNIPIKELPEVFGEERLADRIGDMTQEIHFVGASKRGKRK